MIYRKETRVEQNVTYTLEINGKFIENVPARVCLETGERFFRLRLWMAIASRYYLGNPKVPTVFVYRLVEGNYQVERFTGCDRMISPTFPELDVTVDRVFKSSQIQKL